MRSFVGEGMSEGVTVVAELQRFTNAAFRTLESCRSGATGGADWIFRK